MRRKAKAGFVLAGLVIGVFGAIDGLPAEAIEAGRKLRGVGDVHLTAFGPNVILLRH